MPRYPNLIRAKARGLSLRTDAQTLLYLTQIYTESGSNAAIFIFCLPPNGDRLIQEIVPQSTDTLSLTRDTPKCARSTLVIVVQVR